MENDFLQTIEYWHWWIAAFVFLILEIIIPGFILVWFGFGAFVVGLTLFIFDISADMQLLIWAVISVASILGWRAWRKTNPAPENHSTLNKRGHDYIGRRFTLTADVVNGYGKIKVDDTTWKVELDDDLQEGQTVIITGVDGTVLVAEKMGE